MKLPKRVPQHISETASFKLFSSKIPDAWIIRDVTERDYGIDCYLELVNDNNELSGELALIQLKSRQTIPWTQEGYFTLTGIDISTSNYWYRFAVPVFIFLADISNQELYFTSVDSYIKRNFSEFKKQIVFNYRMRHVDKFEGKAGILAFKLHYYYEFHRQQFENELLFFLSNLQHFNDFQNEHDNRDFHLGIESNDLIYFEAMHRNYDFLCSYFGILNPIPSIRDIKKRSREKFQGEYYYELYEHDLTEWVGEFQKLTLEILTELKQLIEMEHGYWIAVHLSIFNYVRNIKDDGTLLEW
jgi:hypothetical protein